MIPQVAVAPSGSEEKWGGGSFRSRPYMECSSNCSVRPLGSKLVLVNAHIIQRTLVNFPVVWCHWAVPILSSDPTTGS